MSTATDDLIGAKHKELAEVFPKWEKTKDCIDQFIDIILNYRQSGHPGGSRSKVHALLTTLLGGFMRWDIRHPEKRFGDRFLLGAGHTVPLIYCTLAVLNEALRAKHEQTGNASYAVPEPQVRRLTWEDLLGFRRNKGLAGHAEQEGKTLFLKFNTGPSGHGLPAAVGEAVALKRAGAEGVKVILFEGEGGLTPGSAHETKNSAWGLGLDNLYFCVDWNNFGIDDRPASSVVHGTPVDWFEPYGWRVFGTEGGSEWNTISEPFIEALMSENVNKVPTMIWFKTRKGRGYLKYDNKSHGSPHPMNHELFWQTKKEFMDKYGVVFDGYGQPAPKDSAAIRQQFANNLKVVAEVIRSDQELVTYLADRLVEVGESVPESIPSFRLKTSRNPFEDPRLYNFREYPKELFVPPGAKEANRAGWAKWGAWVNALGRKEYGRPLFLAMSADLADSTNISGFSKDFDDVKGYGWYERQKNPEGVLLPQEITEFTNSGATVGIACVNLSETPYEKFDGFYGACSTYGSFVYLKYGPMRLFSQLAQDSQIQVGKVILCASHSGPETAEDSRTHFGILAPGVTQLFPDGQCIDLHPWEHNEVAPVLGAAMSLPAHVIALHLTRPAIVIPDREALGIPSHFEAARGAYVLRDYRVGEKPRGTLIVQGTSTTANIIKILPALDENKLNVKIVAAISPQLFAAQSPEYRESVLSSRDWIDSTVISNRGRRLMHDWIFTKISEEYALTSDW
ncbi:MAG: transketolase, partial [Acidobacteriia bacterium]|nr:transketolase [Terriglobia bacterium]